MSTNASSIIFFSALLMVSCATEAPFYNDSVRNWEESVPGGSSELVYEVFLVGDSRRAFEDTALLEMMHAQFTGAGENSAVVFLGDNVHPVGLPDSTDRHWEVARNSLDAHKDLLKDFQGEIFFIPGNHDWARGGRDGLYKFYDMQCKNGEETV